MMHTRALCVRGPARIALIRRKSHVYTKAKVTTSKSMFRYKEDGIRQASKLAEESLGYSSLRPQQEKIVSTFVQGNDAIKRDFSLI